MLKLFYSLTFSISLKFTVSYIVLWFNNKVFKKLQIGGTVRKMTANVRVFCKDMEFIEHMQGTNVQLKLFCRN